MENKFDILPNEIIHKIFEYLTVLDRNTAGLTCLRFHEILQHTLFINEIEIKFDTINFNNLNPALKCLLESERHYSNVSFKCIEFDNEVDFGSKFWLNFGTDIKSLKLDECEFKSINQIISILKQLPNLQTLALDNVIVKYDINNIFNPNKIDELEGCLNKITTFIVRCWCSSTNILIPKMIHLFPNVEHLTLLGYQETPPVDDEETWELLNQYFIKQAKKLKTLNIQEWSVSHEDIVNLTQIEDFNLESLDLRFFYFQPNERYEKTILNFLKKQKRLKCLKLSSHQVIDSYLITICKHLKDLKVFELDGSELTDIGMAELKKLQNLETLTLRSVCMDPQQVMMNNLDKYKYDKLRKLDICFYSIEQNEENYIFFKEFTQSYKNLTELKLDVNELDDIILQIIIKNLKYLHRLQIDKCSNITDYGITGEINSEFKEKYSVGLSIATLRGLKFLYLKNIKQISEKSLIQIVKCNELKELVLVCSLINIEPNNLNLLLKQFRSLRSFTIFNCNELMLENISTITRNLTAQLKCYIY